MTLVSYDARMDLQPRRSSLLAALMQAPLALAERLMLWHQHQRQMRALESMPADLRKDLGWPAADQIARPRR